MFPCISSRVFVARTVLIFWTLCAIVRFEPSASGANMQLQSASLLLSREVRWSNRDAASSVHQQLVNVLPRLTLRGGKAKKFKGKRRDSDDEGEMEMDVESSWASDDSAPTRKRRTRADDDASDDDDVGGQRGPKLLNRPRERPKEDQFDFRAYEGDDRGEMLQIGRKPVDKLDIDISAGIQQTHKKVPSKAKKQPERRRPAVKSEDEDGGEPADEAAEGDDAKRGKRQKGDKTAGVRLSKKEKKEARKALRRGLPATVDLVKDFGHETADMAVGEAFEERVGTHRPDQNKFFLPDNLEEAYIAPGDPLGRIQDDEQAQRLRKQEKSIATEEKKIKKAKAARAKRGRGVMYISNFPYGFYDDEQFKYFSQFGEVTRLRLARHKRSGGYKGYGFIEFRDRAVAEKVVHDHDGFSLMNKQLVCRIVPPEELHADTFKECKGKPVARFTKVDRQAADLKRQRRKRSLAEQIRLLRKRIRVMKARQAKLRRTRAFEKVDMDDPNSFPIDEMRSQLAALLGQQQAQIRRKAAAPAGSTSADNAASAPKARKVAKPRERGPEPKGKQRARALARMWKDIGADPVDL